jgi:phosphoribosylaminoimidazolecarboxamide formyltransferase/IMP cyclohydrolase
MIMTTVPVKRALLSVSNKLGIVELAQNLVDLGVEIISTGGTSKALGEAGIPHRQVDEVTKLPEMLDGRVKTLHPLIHGAILGKRDKHAEEAARHHIDWIDLVVVNFYPFEEATKNNTLTLNEAIEFIDIGGPTMVRAAAKNFAWVGVVVDPNDYAHVIDELNNQSGLTLATRKQLASKVFALTAHYDSMIHQYLVGDKPSSADLSLQFKKSIDLRYGENPHQQAHAYQLERESGGILSAKQYQGKPLSFNNIIDAEAAWNAASELDKPGCVIVKHANPCGAAVGDNIDDAYTKAYQADSLSAFGGIVALNRPCTKAIAEAITSIFMEVILAPEYAADALSVLAAKPNLRVLGMHDKETPKWEMKYITGGMLMQEKDIQNITKQDLKVVTQAKPSAEEVNSMLFAWQVLKHIKSNGILIVRDGQSVGLGAGQVSRVDAVDLALRKAGDNTRGSVLASDAFFPFRDSIDRLAGTGIRAIIQPGGSVRDDEVISACNEHGIAMVFTGKRCFKH